MLRDSLFDLRRRHGLGELQLSVGKSGTQLVAVALGTTQLRRIFAITLQFNLVSNRQLLRATAPHLIGESL